MTSAAAPAPAPFASHGSEIRPWARCVLKSRSPRGRTPHTAPGCPDSPRFSRHTIHRGQNRPHLPQKNTARRSTPHHPRSPGNAAASRPSESSGLASPPPSPSFRATPSAPPPPRGPAPPPPSAAPPPRPLGRPSSKTAAPPMPQIKFSRRSHSIPLQKAFYASALQLPRFERAARATYLPLHSI